MRAMEKRNGWRLFMVTSLLLGAFIVETQGKCIMDLVFAMDESTSQKEDDFDKTITFAADMVKMPKLNIGSGSQQSRVGLLTFSTRVTTHFELNAHNNAADAAADILDILFNGGKTATHLAMNEMKRLFDSKGREGVAKIGLMTTDGKPDNLNATKEAVKRYKSKGYILFIVGVGPSLDEKALKPLASKPEYYRKVLNYDDLTGTISNILDKLCDINVTTTTAPAPSTTVAPDLKHSVDIVFALGYSSIPIDVFFNMTNIVEILIGDLKYFGQPHGSLAGLITFNPVDERFGLFDYTNKNAAINAVKAIKYPGDYDAINLQMGFHAAHRMLMNGRLSARKIAVFLINRYIQEPLTEQEASRLKADKVIIVIIHVGRSKDNALLISFASTPALYFRITDPFNLHTIVPRFIDQIYRFDVGIGIDRTITLLPPSTFNNVLDIVRNIIQFTRRFGDVDSGTLAGLLQFSATNNTIFGLSTHSVTSSAKSDAIAAVSGVTADVNGTRNTHLALDGLSDMISPYRVGASKAAILITNAEPNQDTAAQSSAAALKNAGVEVSVIEFGPTIHNSLVSLASRTVLYYNYDDPSFNSFYSAFVTNVIYGSVRLTDVSIGLYRSNDNMKFSQLQSIAKHVLNDLPHPFGTIQGSHAGLISFETSNAISVNFGLNALPVLNDAVAAVDDITAGPMAGSKQTHRALLAMASMLGGAAQNGDRKIRVAILITDCTVNEADPLATVNEAAALKAAGYFLVIIDVGSSSINLFCRDLASTSRHYILVSSAMPQHYANLAIRRSHVWPYPPYTTEVTVVFDHCTASAQVFQDMTSLAAQMVATLLDVGVAQGTLISAGKFNTTFTSEFDFYQYATSPAIQSALTAIVHDGGGLSLTAGLAGAASLLDQGRYGAKKIAIVMLCGAPSPNDMTAAIAKAQEMKTQGIIIFVIEFCATTNNIDLETQVASSRNIYYRQKVKQALNSVKVGKEVAAQASRVDVAIALDRTIPIPPSSSFNDILDIVRYIIDFLPNMGEENWAATAFFEFSTTVNKIFGLGSHFSPPWRPHAKVRAKADVSNASPDFNGNRNTHLAIYALIDTLLNGRPEAHKRAILITGADPSNIIAMDKAISDLNDLGFELLIIDFSSSFHPNLYKYVTNRINYINTQKSNDIPMSSAFIANRVLGNAPPSDFVIAMCHCNKTSTNSFIEMKSVATDVLRGLPKFGELSGSFAGFISFKSSANEEFGLDKFTVNNGQTVQNAIQAVNGISTRLTGVKNTHLALMGAKTMLDGSTRSSRTKKNIVILITDCSVNDADPLATASGAAAIKAAGYTLVIMDVGSKSLSVFCRDLASSLHHYIFVSNANPQQYFANLAITKGFEFARPPKQRDMTIVFDNCDYASAVFPAMKSMAVKIVGNSQFVGVPQGTLVSAGTFNTAFTKEFDLYKYDNIPAVQSGLTSIVYKGGNLSVTAGLVGAADLLSKGRPGSDKIVIVMLCGAMSSSDLTTAIQQSQKMRRKKITIAIIEFCTTISNRELRELVAFSPKIYYRQEVKHPLSPSVIRNEVEDQVSRIDVAIGVDRTITLPALSSFDDVLQIVRYIIDFLYNFGHKDGSLAAFLEFSDAVNNLFGLNTHTVPPWRPSARNRAKADVSNASPDPGGNRNTHIAIKALTDILVNGRPGASKVAVLITGGDSSNITETDAAVEYLKNAGVKLFIIDFSSSFHRSLYKYVKSPKHYINNNNKNETLGSAANVVNIASGRPPPINVVIAMCHCKTVVPFDVMTSLTADVLRSLPKFGELSGTYAGLISFKNIIREEFGLETYTEENGKTLQEAILAATSISPRLTGVKNTHLALLEAKAMLENIDDQGVHGSVIVISDCTVPENKITETVLAASAIKSAGYILVFIDAGSPVTNIFCRDLASSLSHYILVNTAEPQQYFTNRAVSQIFMKPKIKYNVDVAVSLDVSGNSTDSFAEMIAYTNIIVENVPFVGIPQGSLIGTGIYSDDIPEKSYAVSFLDVVVILKSIYYLQNYYLVSSYLVIESLTNYCVKFIYFI